MPRIDLSYIYIRLSNYNMGKKKLPYSRDLIKPTNSVSKITAQNMCTYLELPFRQEQVKFLITEYPINNSPIFISHYKYITKKMCIGSVLQSLSIILMKLINVLNLNTIKCIQLIILFCLLFPHIVVIIFYIE